MFVKTKNIFEHSHKLRVNQKGQALIETSISLIILLTVLFLIITIGFYIFNLTVFTFGTNKALDRGVSLLSRNNAELYDSISGNEFSSSEKDEIVGILLDSSNMRIFSPDVPFVNILTNEYNDKIELVVTLKASYDCLLPFVNTILPDYSIRLKYYHAKMGGRE